MGFRPRSVPRLKRVGPRLWKVCTSRTAPKLKGKPFFTALYHCQIDPRCTSDVDGNYISADNKIHRANNFTYRTVFSGWDVFRSQFPLLTIVAPGNRQ